MIICHELELIFLKTKKTSGTSFEIALAGHCGPGCIITPISALDEATRTGLGYRAPQNYKAEGLGRFFFPSRKAFGKHMPADQVRAKLPTGIWRDYRSFTIVRNPYDRAISRYFWDVKRGRANGLGFEDFFARRPDRLLENMRIAPLSGPNALDVYLRYENLQEDLEVNDLGFLWQVYQGLSAKSGYRPATGATPSEMYSAHPKVAQVIAETCHSEIERFGYEPPV